jgi:predicted ATPase
VLVIETHSENLLLSVQLQIAEGLISPDDVAVYWIEHRADGGSLIRTIELDEQGQAINWPRGVFSEDLQLARKLYLTRQGARRS